MGNLVSIIVPVYNVEKYIHKAIDSILNQTYKNIEIILIDDGSPDNCPAICDAYATQDHRVKVVHQQNSGLAASRMKGIAFARGEYILFIDSDDWIEPAMVEDMLLAAEKNDADIVVCDYKTFAGENEEIVSNKVRKNHNTPIKAYAAKSFCWIALTISGFIYERLLDQSSLYSII